MSILVLQVALVAGCGDAQKGADLSKIDASTGPGEDGGGSGGGSDAATEDAATTDSGPTLATCETTQCNEKASCADSSGEAKCTCNSGYTGDGTTCDDTNECDDDKLNTCDAHASCKNTNGGFTCACKAGYTGNGFTCTDADECAAGLQACPIDSTCSNTSGAAECECNAGYEADGDDACKDIDECSGANAVVCGSNQNCVNTPGSSFCECATGYHNTAAVGDPVVCAVNAACGGGCDTNAACVSNACVCNNGYSGDGSAGHCADINECDPLASMHDCSSVASCTNTAGGFTCTCGTGFTGNGKVCTDIDECDKNTDDCAATATCTNNAGSFTCTCPTGYGGDGKTCTPINECATPSLNNCDVNAKCTDKTPGYTCECKAGFTGNGTVCTDINECSNSTLNTCVAGETCTNTAGGFLCGCNDPYVKNGGKCYCDLSGFWGVRQEVNTTWPALTGALGVVLLKAGSYHTTVWELHRMRYDGTTVEVDKKGCEPAGTPDLQGGPLVGTGSETYGTYIPGAAWNAFPLFEGVDVPLDAAKPGTAFVTPKEASVLGVKLANDVTSTWPTSYPANIRTDVDVDGIDGLMVWSHTPAEQTHASTPSNKKYYSYAPLTTSERVACVSTATRVINHLDGVVESCTRITGSVKRDKAPGQDKPRVEQHIYDCRRVPKPVGSYAGACTKAAWDGLPACTADDITGLNAQTDNLTTTSTFEMVKLSDNPDATNITCQTVKSMLPAYP